MSHSHFLRNFVVGTLFLRGSIAVAIISGQNIDHAATDVTAPMVALQMSEAQADGSKRYYKGASFLIASDLLLTAGHNVVYVPESKNVEAIFASAPCWGPNICRERRIKASTTLVHPFFRQVAGGTEYDVAIVKLPENSPQDYRPLPLIGTAMDIGKKRIQSLGFGTDREAMDAPLSAFRLRSIYLSAAEPTYRLGSAQKFWLDQRRGGICSGDSGGPAIISDGAKVAAIGLAIHVTYSDGVGHCLTKAAFTDILFFNDWIDSAIAHLHAW